MNIEKIINGTELTLIFEGRLDTNTSKQAEESIKDSIEGIQNITMDFGKLVYVSSAGLRVILSVQKKMNAVGGELVITNVNDVIMEVFEITGFSDMLTIK